MLIRSPRIEPHNRRVEPIEPVESRRSEGLTFLKFYWFYWFYTPVVWFYTWFYGGSIGSTRLPTKNQSMHLRTVWRLYWHMRAPAACVAVLHWDEVAGDGDNTTTLLIKKLTFLGTRSLQFAANLIKSLKLLSSDST